MDSRMVRDRDGAGSAAFAQAGMTAPAAPDDSSSPDGQQPAAPLRRVLVVDDEFTIRMLITEVLTDVGYETIEAADGPSALAVLTGDEAVDLLVTDMGLPGGMSGRELAEAARRQRPGLSVLFITGYADGSVLPGTGAHVLVKPFSMEALAMKVDAILST